VDPAHAAAHGLGQVTLRQFGIFLKKPQEPEAGVFPQLGALASHQDGKVRQATASGLPLRRPGFNVRWLKTTLIDIVHI
jgi:hypothetical protein